MEGAIGGFGGEAGPEAPASQDLLTCELDLD